MVLDVHFPVAWCNVREDQKRKDVMETTLENDYAEEWNWLIETENRHTPANFCYFGFHKTLVFFLNFCLENIVKDFFRVGLHVIFQARKKNHLRFSKRPLPPFPLPLHDQHQRSYNVWSTVVNWVVVFAEILGNKFSDGMLRHLREEKQILARKHFMSNSF